MPESLVIFPDHYPTLEDQRNYPLLIGGFDQKEVTEVASQKIFQAFDRKSRIGKRQKCPAPKGEAHFKFIQLGFQGRVLYLAIEDFLVFNPPIQSKSQKQGSQALYYAANKEKGLLLQYLPPNSKTSAHNHEIYQWEEYYYLLAGSAILRTSQGQHLLAETNSLIVKPEIVHQVVTEDLPSLILIEIKGDPQWFDRWESGKGHCFKELL